jgi:hypothetical protein
MSRSIAMQAVACLVSFWAFAAAAQTESAPKSDPGSNFSDAGTHIKQGAENFGEGIKQGAEMVGEKIKNTAIDVWEAGKAAVDAGSRKMNGPRATSPAKE